MTPRPNGVQFSLPILVPTTFVTLGAALAGYRWFWDHTDRLPLVILTVGGAVAAGVIVASLLVRDRPPVRESPPLRQAPDPSEGISQIPDPGRADGRSRPGPGAADTWQVLLPLDEVPRHAGAWWDRSSPARPARPGAPPLQPSRDLASYRDAAQIVQCPRCGAFRIDVTDTGAGFAFRCRIDDHKWTWQPGTAWPATVVASRRRTTNR